jgi:hypothetical protein
MLFNRTKPTVYGGIPAPLDGQDYSFLGTNPSDRALFMEISPMKYADFTYARMACNSSLVRYLLDSAPIVGRHKRVLVDIKVHDLKEGEYTCMPGWHLDGSVNIHGADKQPELHHLFIAGPSARTEFLDIPIELPIDPKWDFAQKSRLIGAQLDKMKGLPVFTAPNCEFVTYDDSYFHRGTAAQQPCVRLLVRVTETDVILPQNKINIPYTHPASR